jgi:TonB-dependent receptor
MGESMISRKKLLNTLMVITMLIVTTAPASAGNVSGTITGSDTKLPLTGANVVVEGTSRGSATDLDGVFVIFNLQPGEYTVRFTMLGYEPMTREITVPEDGGVTVDVEMSSSAVELQEVTYIAGGEVGSQERELAERLDENNITDAVSKEVLRKLPDPDVANVVRRATGVSVDKGDPIIRGLGVRYSKVTLNNAAVAGTEPNRSAVSLELFPASLMSQVTINKSYLPDQNGEFAGGTVNMNTFELPRDLEISASVSSSYNSRTTFKDFYTYQGGAYDYLGFDDGSRAMPDIVANAEDKLASSGISGDYGYSPNELKVMGKSFQDVWSPSRMTARPNQSYNLSIGNRLNAFGFPMGYVVTGVYGHSYKFEDGDRNVYKGGDQPGTVTDWHSYNFNTYKEAVTLGSMLALKFYPHDLHNLNLNVLYSRDVTDETRLMNGYNDDKGTLVRDTRLRFTAEETITTQFFGNHAFPAIANSTVDWQATWSRGTRYEPDTREQLYELNNDGFYNWADESQSASHLFNDLEDNTLSASVDWTSRPEIGLQGLQVKTGAAVKSRERNSNYRKFQYKATAQALETFDLEFLSQDPEVVFADENIHPFGWEINEYTRPNDSYQASHDVLAGYAMTEASLHPRLHVTGGVRIENSDQSVVGYEPFTPQDRNMLKSSTISTIDVLPAVSMKYLLRQRMNLRIAASQTVSRPDFREMAEFEYTDFVGGYAVIGNPELQRALIRNYDLRWEMVHGVADLVAVSVFYKNFENPIETVLQNTAQIRLSYDNAESANNYGIEFEIRQNLGLFSDVLKTVTMSGNLSLIESRVDLGSGGTAQVQTSNERALAGQSPYLLNLGIGYIHPRYGTQLNLFYHTFGERISEVGANDLPDVYEQPHHDLDLTANHPLTRNLKLKFGFKNILDSEIRFEQGGKPTWSYYRGSSVSIGLSYSN